MWHSIGPDHARECRTRMICDNSLYSVYVCTCVAVFHRRASAKRTHYLKECTVPHRFRTPHAHTHTAQHTHTNTRACDDDYRVRSRLACTITPSPRHHHQPEHIATHRRPASSYNNHMRAEHRSTYMLCYALYEFIQNSSSQRRSGNLELVA